MELWLPSLITDTPQSGYELAVKLSRMAVKMTQPDEQIRQNLRHVYAQNANSLTFVSGVVALNFQTVSTANNYWRTKK